MEIQQQQQLAQQGMEQQMAEEWSPEQWWEDMQAALQQMF
jgi:sugar (pentulose or hexulose) kinase